MSQYQSKLLCPIETTATTVEELKTQGFDLDPLAQASEQNALSKLLEEFYGVDVLETKTRCEAARKTDNGIEPTYGEHPIEVLVFYTTIDFVALGNEEDE